MLKPIIIAIAMASLTSSCASAQNVTVREMCLTYASFAEAVMYARQDGASLQEVLDIFTRSGAESDLTALIAMEAFMQPRYSSLEDRKLAIADFRDLMHVLCLRSQR